MADNDFTDEEIRAWDLPFVEDEFPEPDKTNAFNRRSDWRYEPPEVEEEVLPPTAEEIEAIRNAAYKEGFEQGHQEGLEKGLEEGREQGHQEGLEQGLNEGREQGIGEGKERIDALSEQWQSVLEHLHQPLAAVDLQLQNELVLLAVNLAKSVLHSEVSHSSESLLQALSEGLKVLPIDENSYQIHMHPDDIKMVMEHYGEEHIEKHHWNLVEAPYMQRGGCDIVTRSNAVDMTLERRMRDVFDKFLLEQGLDTHNPS